MKCTIVFLIFSLFLSSANCMEVKFTDQLKNYFFKIDSYGVEYKSSFANIMIWNSKCNKDFIHRFEKDLKKQLRSRAVSSNEAKTFSVTIDGKHNSLLKKSPLGQYLFSLDRKVLSLRLKEKIECE